MNEGVKITNVKLKPLNWDDIHDMVRITCVNVRGLKASINHLSAMVEHLSAKKDEDARKEYQRRIKRAQRRLTEETMWNEFFNKLITNKQAKKNGNKIKN